METDFLIVASTLAFTCVVIWCLIGPLTVKSSIKDFSEINDSERIIEDQKQQIARFLQDLDFDHSTGKLQDEDYNTLRAEGRQRLAKLLVNTEG